MELLKVRGKKDRDCRKSSEGGFIGRREQIKNRDRKSRNSRNIRIASPRTRSQEMPAGKYSQAAACQHAGFYSPMGQGRIRN